MSDRKWRSGSIFESHIQFQKFTSQKLMENSFKKGWSDLSDKWIINRMRQEIKEIETVLKKGGDYETVSRECADVANFAMMLSDNHWTTEKESGEG